MSTATSEDVSTLDLIEEMLEASTECRAPDCTNEASWFLVHDGSCHAPYCQNCKVQISLWISEFLSMGMTRTIDLGNGVKITLTGAYKCELCSREVTPKTVTFIPIK